MQRNQFLEFGIDPSPTALQIGRENGLNVSQGLYPQDINANDGPFDVISFIDVLEHLPEPAHVLDETRKLLGEGGVVIVQAPDQNCLLYELGRFLAIISFGKIDSPIRRLWLTDLDFPHLFYFNQASLARLLTRTGFNILHLYRSAISSPSLALNRVCYLKKRTTVYYADRFLALVVAAINVVDRIMGRGGLLICVANKDEKK